MYINITTFYVKQHTVTQSPLCEGYIIFVLSVTSVTNVCARNSFYILDGKS